MHASDLPPLCHLLVIFFPHHTTSFWKATTLAQDFSISRPSAGAAQQVFKPGRREGRERMMDETDEEKRKGMKMSE